MDPIAAVMAEVRRLVALPGNDFAWSGWEDAEEALAEIDACGDPTVLFLPTGPLQELSLSSGWGDEFCALADRFDVARSGVATHLCVLCGQPAGTLVAKGDALRRESFTSTLRQPLTDAVRGALHAAAALHALDPELAPFFCPRCGESYCGAHWRRWDVFDDDGFHDGIRGVCPRGHERLLED